MSTHTIPRVKLVIVTAISSVIEIAVFLFFAMLLLAIGVASAFGGVSDNLLISIAAPLIGLIGLALSTLICPVVAFLFRKTIVRASSDSTNQFLIFVGISVSPVLLYGVGYYTGLLDLLLQSLLR